MSASAEPPEISGLIARLENADSPPINDEELEQLVLAAEEAQDHLVAVGNLNPRRDKPIGTAVEPPVYRFGQENAIKANRALSPAQELIGALNRRDFTTALKAALAVHSEFH